MDMCVCVKPRNLYYARVCMSSVDVQLDEPLWTPKDGPRHTAMDIMGLGVQLDSILVTSGSMVGCKITCVLVRLYLVSLPVYWWLILFVYASVVAGSRLGDSETISYPCLPHVVLFFTLKGIWQSRFLACKSQIFLHALKQLMYFGKGLW